MNHKCQKANTINSISSIKSNTSNNLVSNINLNLNLNNSAIPNSVGQTSIPTFNLAPTVLNLNTFTKSNSLRLKSNTCDSQPQILNHSFSNYQSNNHHICHPHHHDSMLISNMNKAKSSSFKSTKSTKSNSGNSYKNYSSDEDKSNDVPIHHSFIYKSKNSTSSTEKEIFKMKQVVSDGIGNSLKALGLTRTTGKLDVVDQICKPTVRPSGIE